MKVILTLVFVFSSVSALFAQSAAVRQFEQSTYEASLDGAKDLHAPVDVWIIPMAGMPDLYVTDLVSRLKSDTGLIVRSSVAAGFGNEVLLPGTKQINGEQILKEMSSPINNLHDKKPATIFILVSAADLNDSSGTKRFLFALNNSTSRRAVISVARMRLNQDGTEEAPVLTKIRLFKMAKKQIGELYYGYPRSSDLNSVMYSPIMGIDDLDMIGTDFPK
jgi:predicted Zn-dependent protease